MSEPDIDSINHVGIVARDLAATSARYEALGFTLTPFSPHSGAWKPGEPVQRLGSGNRCVMFGRNYLEILANEDAAQPSARLEGYLRHHQGGHIICFNSENLPSVERRITDSGLKTSGVLPLQREIDTPEGVRTAKFERAQFAPDESPEGYIQAARHLTPQYIYQPRYTGHENGCTELSSGYVVVDDLRRFRERYEVYTGLRPRLEEGAAIFDFALCSRLVLMDTARALRDLPGTLYPPLPGIAAVGFRCPDVPAQAQRLRARRIPFATTAEGRLVVPAEEASGIAVVFEPLEKR
ncbi:VOC family protein [Ramlibacter rhizophilus]|uniref:VOC family protein n=1 Tax=Ramlibacter rhizophilus TaxID=1781167 RepID=UPI00143249B2|nr:VOC family protein [Ramlibacter rhizophilus]